MADREVNATWKSDDDLAGLERTIRFFLTASEFRREVDAKLWSACMAANVRGFRKGKVPFDVGRRLWGRDAVEKVAEDLVTRITNLVLEDPRAVDGTAGQPTCEEPVLSDEGLAWAIRLPLKAKPAPGTYVDFSRPHGAST